jgi:hypothetical protein
MVIHPSKSGRGREGYQIIQGSWFTAFNILETVEVPIITDNGLDRHPLDMRQGKGVFKVEIGTGKKFQRPQKSSTVGDSQPRQGDDREISGNSKLSKLKSQKKLFSHPLPPR